MLTVITMALLHALIPRVTRAWCQMTTRGSTQSDDIPEACSTDGLPLKWDRRCMEVAVAFEDDGELPNSGILLTRNEVVDIVRRSFQAWESVSLGDGLEVTLHESPSSCDRAEFNVVGGNMNTIIFVRDWSARGFHVNGQLFRYDPSAFAVTTAWHNVETGVILDADIEVNEQRGPYIDCTRTCEEGGCVGLRDQEGRQVVDLLNVLTHEVGHFWGLDHPVLDESTPEDESLATMWARSPAGEVCKRDLSQDDRNGLQSIYPAEAMTGLCDSTPLGGRTFECGGGGGEGCACSAAAPTPSKLILWLFVVGFLVLRNKSNSLPGTPKR